jgi:uracil phosphoribosyltransferase
LVNPKLSFTFDQTEANMIYNFDTKPSIVNRYIAELRDTSIQKNRMIFRRNLERIGEIVAYEISKSLIYEAQEVETPLGIAMCNLPTQRIVIATILRAGLPLHQGILNVFDHADNAFVSAYRKHHKDGTFEISVDYVTCPDLSDCVLILVDPMLATGSSIDASLKAMESYGKPQKIHVVTAIGSSYGVQHIQRFYPNLTIWAGAIDDELTAKSYIVPGLGDAGDLAYGNKLQD